MRRLTATLFASLLATLIAAAPAPAAFGLGDFDVTFTDAGGAPVAQAGAHPFAMRTSFDVNSEDVGGGNLLPEEAIKDLFIAQVPGFAGDQGLPRCSTLDFLTKLAPSLPACADSAVIGVAKITVGEGKNAGSDVSSPVYNLPPAPGTVAKIGWWTQGVPVSVDIGIEQAPPYRILALSENTSQVLEVLSVAVTLWGVPADPAHDPVRGKCLTITGGSNGACPAGTAVAPFLTLPRACEGPLATAYEASSWPNPSQWVAGSSLTHDDAVPPNPRGFSGCGKLGFGPLLEARPGVASAESASGLEVALEVNDEGLKGAAGIAQADISAVEVTLPEGMTANPSAAEGLGVCMSAQYGAERLGAPASQGCPEAAKLGTLEAETPLLENHTLRGALYLAAQDDNPFGSLLALYLVVEDPGLGVFIKLAGEVSPDPRTGQLITRFEGLPPYPLSEVALKLREGPRAPLVTPPGCGAYEVEAELTPSSGAPPLPLSSSFQIASGPSGGPCPSGAPPFDPGFDAGTLSNAAGSHSPFQMRLTRADGEQDLTRFSAKLPPGVVAKLAGTSFCPEASIAAAKAREGREELASPSCPASSLLGQIKAGAGVGAVLTYVPGSVYLAGPFGGAPLSVVGVVPAVAGPFDVGTVVTRFALQIDPRTAEVRVDGSGSDPIPHILAGIPLKVRDVQVSVDRPEFTLNPTSCDPFAVAAELWGGGTDAFSSADDAPASVSAHFQAASCGSLGFKPRLALKLKGGTRRGGHPALTGEYRPRPGDANLSGLVLRLPRSAFLDQAHIRTICTRVQFAAKACPAAAVYGHATAHTPLLSEPLSGPVYLRSSNHNLPDFVADLHGLIDVEAVARIDSKKGGIRATFTDVPDAPLSRVVVRMQGAKKGLIVNSRNLCAGRSRANAAFSAHNGARAGGRPVVQPTKCRKGRSGRKGKAMNRGQRASAADRADRQSGRGRGSSR